MRILLATDAWAPQLNGVVVTLANTVRWLERWGHEVHVLSPEGFRTIPMPTYPDIPLAVLPGRKVAERFGAFDPDAVHIATEGPIGIAARAHCLKNRLAFTTAYHTCFPEYVKPRFGVPLALTYAWLRRFHGPSSAVLVATPAISEMLARRGFARIAEWSRGVDPELFRPARERRSDLPRPVFLYVGRLAVEKNIPAFLGLDLPGSKVVVGDGPQREELERRFPGALFVGAKHGEELASYYQQADVFVFPSRTDTFGLVLAEAMACGTPVAAFPVRGPIDVVREAHAGVLDEDLRSAALAALALDRDRVLRYAARFSWQASSAQFVSHLVPAREGGDPLPHAA
ncbi:MAG TPA: glycosyltransferase family 1 protein [Usitatibacter sp.]|nr:glycosyltransferase family 1 protein [Usitatibacter sp.]